jgi:xanthine dehydrogenase YagT iron-sulfur-binding subunit
MDYFKISRRRFHEIALASTALAMVGRLPEKAMAQTKRSLIASQSKLTPEHHQHMKVKLTVNGSDHLIDVDTRTTLLDLLREKLKLTGSKKGCDHGQCGACTVLVNGKRIYSCMTLAVMHEGDAVTTIEGLANGDTLHPMQEEFIACDAFQCGYCTPGQIMSAVGLLKEGCGPKNADVRECMSGNICRCGAYVNIVAAIQAARKGGK